MGERGKRWEGKERLKWAGGLRGDIRYNSISFDIISISFGYHLDIMISKLDII